MEKLLKRSKIWNTLLLIFGTIGALVSLIDVPRLLSNEKQLAFYQKQVELAISPEIRTGLEQAIGIVTTPWYRIYSLVMLVISVVLVVAFFINNKRLKDRLAVQPWPYYLQIVKIVLAMGVSVVTNALAFNISTSVLTIFLNLVWAVPAGLMLFYRKQILDLRQKELLEKKQ